MLPRGDVVIKEYIDQWLHLAKAAASTSASSRAGCQGSIVSGR